MKECLVQVRWAGYPSDDENATTWEPYKTMKEDVPTHVDEYMRKNGLIEFTRNGVVNLRKAS